MSNLRETDRQTIPTHPADPVAGHDEDKIVGEKGAVRDRDYNDPPPPGAGKSTGKPLDEVGGAGLGKPPGE
jgi:hypothetical protein